MGWLFGNVPEKRRYNLVVLLIALFFFVTLGSMFLLGNTRSPFLIIFFSIVFLVPLFTLAALRMKTMLEYYRYLYRSFHAIFARKREKQLTASFEGLPGVNSRAKFKAFDEILRRRVMKKYVAKPISRLLCDTDDVVIVEYVIGNKDIYITCDFRKYRMKMEYGGNLYVYLSLNDTELVEKAADQIYEICYLRR